MQPTSGSLGSWSARSIVLNTFPLLIVLSVIVLWAGITLENAEALLEEYALLAVMVPPMIAMGGNLGAIFSARLSSRLHLGTTEFDPRDRILWANVLAILALAATIFTALAIGAWAIGQVVGAAIGLVDLLTIALVSGMSVAVLAVVMGVVATFGSYRLGMDPDDVTIPVVTNVVDVFGLLVFVAVSTWVLGF